MTPTHAYTLDPAMLEWADYAAVQAYRGNLSGNELRRNLSKNIRQQSSLLAEPLCTDPGIKWWNYCVQANLHFKKKKKKAQAGNK